MNQRIFALTLCTMLLAALPSRSGAAAKESVPHRFHGAVICLRPRPRTLKRSAKVCASLDYVEGENIGY